uniref:Uncharacterized protein n=1 Tax=Rhizophora mucronata TaxID=61149 RepID=A0A2P2NZZ7_RHIMU
MGRELSEQPYNSPFRIKWQLRPDRQPLPMKPKHEHYTHPFQRIVKLHSSMELLTKK